LTCLVQTKLIVLSESTTFVLLTYKESRWNNTCKVRCWVISGQTSIVFTWRYFENPSVNWFNWYGPLL